VPTLVEIQDELRRIEFVLAETPVHDQLTVLQREVASLSPRMRQAVAGFTLLGIRVGMTKEKNNPPDWIPKAAAVSCFLTIGSVFYLIVRPEDLPGSRHTLFDIWMAFCVATSLSFIGGTARASGSIPFFKDSPIRFMAVGGIAVFIISLFILHEIFP
jgi:hypothetical protein